MKRGARGLLALHLVGDALLLWLGYYWLGVGESDGFHLLWSFVVLLLLVCGALWMHGSALVFFREREQSFLRSCFSAARHILPLLGVALVAALLYALLEWLNNRFSHTAFLIASWVTLETREPLAPGQVLRVFQAFFFLLRWLVVPAVLFPIAADVAAFGFRGFPRRHPVRFSFVLRSLALPFLLLAALALPLRLLSWIPDASAFWLQMLSVLGRVGVAYLLLVVGLLGAEFITSRGVRREWNQ